MWRRASCGKSSHHHRAVSRVSTLTHLFKDLHITCVELRSQSGAAFNPPPQINKWVNLVVFKRAFKSIFIYVTQNHKWFFHFNCTDLSVVRFSVWKKKSEKRRISSFLHKLNTADSKEQMNIKVAKIFILISVSDFKAQSDVSSFQTVFTTEFTVSESSESLHSFKRIKTSMFNSK